MSPFFEITWLQEDEACKTRIRQTNANFDLLRIIHQLKSSLPISISYEHVAAHQTKYKTYEELDPVAQLNEDMDTLAKRHWVRTKTKTLPTHSALRRSDAS